MFEVKVTVEIPGLPEAINSLASAICAGATVTTPAPVNPAEVKQLIDFAAAHPYPGAQAPAANPSLAPAAPAPVPTPAAAPAAPVMATAAPAPAVSPSNPVAPVAPVAAPTPAPAAITVEDLGRAGAGLIDAGKMPQLMGLLSKYGVQAITQLQPGQIGPFAAEMQALGVKF